MLYPREAVDVLGTINKPGTLGRDPHKGKNTMFAAIKYDKVFEPITIEIDGRKLRAVKPSGKSDLKGVRSNLDRWTGTSLKSQGLGGQV